MPFEMNDKILRWSLNTFRLDLPEHERTFLTPAPSRSAIWNHDTGNYEYLDYGDVDDFKPYIPADFLGELTRALYDSLVDQGLEPRVAFEKALRAYLGEN